jgi:flagellar hook protein FlgE
MNTIGIAASALSAFATHQSATAGNVANVDTPAYKPSVVREEDVKGGGVRANVSKVNDQVELTKEAVDMMLNSNLFSANSKTVKATDQMTQSILDIKV